MAQKRQTPTARSGKNISSQTKPSSKKRRTKAQTKKQIGRVIRGLALIIIGIFLLLCLAVGDVGMVGNAVKHALMGVLGFAAYVIPFFFMYFGVLFMLREKRRRINLKAVIAVFIVLLLPALVHIFTPYTELSGTFSQLVPQYYESGKLGLSGGVVGGTIAGIIMPLLGFMGSFIVLLILMIVLVMILTNTTPFSIYEYFKKRREKKLARDREELEEERRIEQMREERDAIKEQKAALAAAKKAQKRKKTNIDVPLDDYKFTPISDEMQEQIKRERRATATAHKVTNLSTTEFDAKVQEYSRRAAEEKKRQVMEQEMAAKETEHATAAAAHTATTSRDFSFHARMQATIRPAAADARLPVEYKMPGMVMAVKTA